MRRPEPHERLEMLKPERPSARQLEGLESLKPGDYEIYNERFNQICLEAREVMCRASISSMSRSGDLVVGVFTADGDLATSTVGTYLHTCVGNNVVKFIVRNWAKDPTVGVHDGDIFYANEALYGGLHNSDQIAVMPVFLDDELIAWTLSAAHQPETGAVDPGGFCLTAKTRCWEGMRLTPIKIGTNFRLHSDMLEMMENMIVRTPRIQNTDVRARATACDRLRRRVAEIAQEKGALFVHGVLRRMIDEAEMAARRKISTWNDGIYRIACFTDTTGSETTLLRLQVTLTKEDDHVTIDLTGTSPEHDGGTMQSHAQGVVSLFSTYLFAHAMHDVPASCGALAPFDFHIPSGTWTNPDPMAAIAGAPPALQPVFGFSYTLFAKMLFDSPDKTLVCASNAENSAGIIAGVNQWGVPVADLIAYPFNATGQGARWDQDGVDAYGFNFAHFGKGPDAEDWENIHPVVHLFQGLLKDSGGFGKYRGGAGVASAQIIYGVPLYSEQAVSPGQRLPMGQGLFGAYPPVPKTWVRIRNSDVLAKLQRGDRDIPTDLHTMVNERSIQGDYECDDYCHTVQLVQRGDIVVDVTSGGPGYGDVLERDPLAVMEDIRKGVISHRTARNVYLVAYNQETLDVDYATTSQLRKQELEARKTRGVPYAEFVKRWQEKRPPDEALIRYGSWPDARKVREIIRI